MNLKAFLTEKIPVACSTIRGLIFITGWCRSTQGASFVIFVCGVIDSVTTVTYYFLAMAALSLVITL
jgi:hypothetical protein